MGDQQTGNVKHDPIMTYGIHPGAVNFNSIGHGVLGAPSTKPYGNDNSPGYHKNDRAIHVPNAAETINTGEFTVPWDNFATGVGALDISITHQMPGATSTIDTDVTPTIPLVPLTITP